MPRGSGRARGRARRWEWPHLHRSGQAGKAGIGVDSSEKILELCEARARTAGVLDRLTLIKGDFRDFELPEPAALITIPFHSIGHLIKEEDKRRALETIRG